HHLARDLAHALITRSQREAAIQAALDAAAAAGLGCVHEMAAPHLNPEDDLVLLTQLSARRATVEVVTYWGEHVSSGGVARAQQLGCAGAAGDLCVDGALGSHTAALDKPYDDRPDHTGYLYLDVDEIAEHVVACTRAGLQAGFHCIGDAAVHAVVDGLRRAEQQVGLESLRARRHRLEHAEMLAPELLPTLATYGVVLSGQPAFDAAWGGPSGMYARRLGADRALLTNPWAQIVDAGVPLAFGSDSPVTPFDPWGAVRAAVDHHHPDARISVEQAFAAHTRGGWHAAGRDDGGDLTVGADATFVVWDHASPDLPELHPDAPSPACVRTVVRGRTVYDRERA
ncbi:amidohydrolase, partial [Thermasporomyces composti]